MKKFINGFIFCILSIIGIIGYFLCKCCKNNYSFCLAIKNFLRSVLDSASWVGGNSYDIRTTPAYVPYYSRSTETKYNRNPNDSKVDKQTYPMLISELEFSRNELGFYQISLYFYEDNKILATEDDEIISDYKSILGCEDLFNTFRIMNKGILYFRNSELETEYEVVRICGSYVEEGE